MYSEKSERARILGKKTQQKENYTQKPLIQEMERGFTLVDGDGAVKATEAD